MPEYLAPGVYVEEIDTGSKPIEGVSTSTAGMLGMTERGPVNVPILITSFGEYQRWFGQYLRLEDFSTNNGLNRHNYLPHAVDGFFTNGGKRVYVVRILDTATAASAYTLLFDRATTASVETFLLAGSASNDTEIVALDGTGLIDGAWLQIGEGSATEYRQVNGTPGAANVVPLNLPISLDHPDTTAVHRLNPAPGNTGGALNLVEDAEPGDTVITLNNSTTVVAGELIRIGTTANGDDEYHYVASKDDASNTVTLRTPLVLAHTAAAGIVQRTNGGTQASPTQLEVGRPASAGSAVVFLQNPASYGTQADFIQITDAVSDNIEVRRIGELSSASISVPAYASYPAGAVVEGVGATDDGGVTAKNIQVDASAGGNVVRLDDRQGLNTGDLVRIGATGDPDSEYVTIQSIPNRLPAPDAGNIILSAALQRDHPAAVQVQRQTVPTTLQAAAALAVQTLRNGGTLVLSSNTGFNDGDVVRISTAGTSYYHLLASDPAATPLDPAMVTLDTALSLPHDAGSPAASREPLQRIEALDPGAWGNRLQVSIQDEDSPLVKTRIRSINDSTHFRLDSANGIEEGSVLELLDGSGAGTGTFLKVVDLDRNNDYLVTLDGATALPGTAVVGSGIRSREFTLNVYLLRQPDPAVPSRNNQVLASESFRYLSMDPRHSRYIQRVIGTTWDYSTPGVTSDHDGNPLRLSDRRSEGESGFVRVRDQGANQTEMEGVRLGPAPLVDTLPDGRTRPAKLPFANGDDSVSQVTDATYIGADDPEPLNRTGLHSLRNEEDISIVACPGRTSTTMQAALIAHCELMRYRFAVLDGPQPPNDSLNDVQAQRQNHDSKYAALYHPWVLIPHPFPTNLANIPAYPIPPSGQIVGIYARTDIERGVHKAPANEVVRGIRGLQRILRKEQQDILNPYPVNINVIRDFRAENRGLRVYGARVITSDPDWKYVNVRRLLIFIEASIDRGLQWVVFEPNAEPLWARVRRSVSNFLTTVWRNGALEGVTREEAYFVKCDRTTMTQADIDNGRLICVIGVAPVKPAEFVIIRIGLWTAHAED